jgi:antirestriction protein
MNYEHEPPAPTPQPDDQSSKAEALPVLHPATSDTTEKLPDSERHEQQQEVAPPQIWVGSLSDYNNGVLHGAWLDAAREPEAIEADIHTMLAASPWTARTGEPAEEWGIFDTDNFGDCRIDQHEDLDWVSGVAQGIAAHGLAFAAWADVIEDPALLAGFEEAYIGEYDSLEAYAEQLVDELGYTQILDDNLPKHIRRYVDINTAGLAQDMWLNGTVHVYHRPGGGVWIFNAN